MFAGFTISPHAFPGSMTKTLWLKTLSLMPNSKRFEDYVPFFKEFQSLLFSHMPLCLNERERDKLLNLSRRIDYMISELEQERTWIVNILPQRDSFEGRPRQFKPIYIDKFLQRKVWYQADKIILSSATIPFRTDLKKWLMRIGLGNKNYSFHSVPMQFPVNNRLIITSCLGGKMTHREEHDSWDENVQIIKEIIKKHPGERGVIHAQSYKRAKNLASELKKYKVFLHDKDEIDGDIIDEWIDSKKLILISPSIKEGVDLKDDLCRFQILLKIPYPSIGDARVKYLLMEKKQWTWYFNETAKDIIQMYGRAVRSETDHAKFYIVDGSFDDVYKKASFPEWFEEAIK
jgi:Rad3-related DNA helicase